MAVVRQKHRVPVGTSRRLGNLVPQHDKSHTDSIQLYLNPSSAGQDMVALYGGQQTANEVHKCAAFAPKHAAHRRLHWYIPTRIVRRVFVPDVNDVAFTSFAPAQRMVCVEQCMCM